MAGGKSSILVVDDEQAQIDLISEALKSDGYLVASATDGFKAIAACKVRMPDLILLDLQMPLMSGLDVFKRLRSDEKTRDIPIIFLRRKGEKPSELAEAPTSIGWFPSRWRVKSFSAVYERLCVSTH